MPARSEFGRARAVTLAVLLGLCSGALFWVFYRVFTVKFPLNFVSPVYASIPLFGIPLGLYFARRVPSVGIRASSLLGAGILLFAVSALAYKDKSVHYLLFGAYYDYPAPASSWVTRGLIASVPLSIVPFLLAARSFALGSVAAGRLALPALLLGIGGGLLLAELWAPVFGAYAILIACCAGMAAFLPHRGVALATAALAVVVGSAMYHPKEAFFTWQLREYTRADTYWTHQYKWDWIEFDDGHCVGGVRNEIMVHYSCDASDKLPLTHLKMAEAISNGPVRRERVLSIGRPDGIIATAHKTRNPHLQRFVAIENDRRVVGDMLARYSRRQGDIFTTDPGIELIGGSERLWLERTDEQFDAVYLDGIGLMLVPFPFTVIEQENYLFSSDAYRRIFDDLLTRDGVLIIDRGTTTEGESQDLAGGLPEGVEVRTLYTKIPTYPLTGLPLVYILASRNGAELDRIARELATGNLYAQDVYDPTVSHLHWSSDDWPMFQPAAILGMHAVMAPFALLTVAFVLWQLKRQVGTLARRDPWWEVGLGIVVAVTAIWLTARGARAFVGGTQLGFAYAFATMCAGMAVGVAAAREWAQRRAIAAAVIACGLAFACALAWPFEPAAALIATGSGGFGLGVLAIRSRASTPDVAPGVELSLGILLGIYVFQLGLLLAGFKLLAAGLLAAIAFGGLRRGHAAVATHAPARPLRLPPDASPV